jgi:hypothetical protein
LLLLPLLHQPLLHILVHHHAPLPGKLQVLQTGKGGGQQQQQQHRQQ